MSAEEEDPVIGRKVKQLTEENKHLLRLLSDAKDTGENLAALGHALQDIPTSVSIDNQEMAKSYAAGRLEFSSKGLDASRILNLVGDIRATLTQVADLREFLKGQGVDLR